MSKNTINLRKKVFIDYIKKKNYEYKPRNETDCIKLNDSNLTEESII